MPAAEIVLTSFDSKMVRYSHELARDCCTTERQEAKNARVEILALFVVFRACVATEWVCFTAKLRRRKRAARTDDSFLTVKGEPRDTGKGRRPDEFRGGRGNISLTGGRKNE